jgi:CDP-diacylglycerol--glycerol-3-phosphate 3-phosphatidyltransferase
MIGSPILKLPLALTLLRAALGPVVVGFALTHQDGGLFAACLILAFLSDYFDGVIARHLGIATENLRRLDSISDSIFYIAALFAAWYLHSALLRPYGLALGVLFALEFARYAFDYRKFGKEASYHMWSSKIWGIALFTGFFALLVYQVAGWPVSLAIYIGIAADVEGLAISFVLPRWQADVPTIFHAIRLRTTEA